MMQIPAREQDVITLNVSMMQIPARDQVQDVITLNVSMMQIPAREQDVITLNVRIFDFKLASVPTKFYGCVSVRL